MIDKQAQAKQLWEGAGGRELPSGWRLVNVGDLLADDRGISVGVMYPGQHVPDGIPLIRVGDILDTGINSSPDFNISHKVHHEYRRTALAGGELLITLVGRPGKAVIVPEGMAGWNAARALAVVRLLDQSSTRYLQYALSSPVLQHLIDGWCNTTVQATLNLKEIKALPIPWPEEDERRHIAAILGALDDKIELNRRMSRTLEEMAQAIFRSWFLDFDGHDDLVDTELGPIPRGWEVSVVEEVVPSVGGATPSTKEPAFWDDGTIHWTTPKDLSGLAAPVLLDTERKITKAGLAKISSGLLPAGTLLMSSRAPVGYLAISQVPVAINQGYIAIPPGGRLSPLFMLFWAQANMDRIKARAGGTTFQEISKQNFRPIPIVVPPPQPVEAFDRVGGALFDRIVSCQRESLTLATLRNALLPVLVSGEVRVGVEQALSEGAA